jgi:hypothetical protein
LVNHNHGPSPLFFVSVADKGLSDAISGLESTLAGRCISGDSRGVTGWRLDRSGAEGEKNIGWKEGTRHFA